MKENTHVIKKFKFLLRFSGLFNILLAFPLIIPHISNWYLSMFSLINSMLGLGGQAYVKPINPVHSLLINTAGIDLVLIGAIVLYASIDPLRKKGIIILNAVGRLVFAFVILYYIIMYDLLRIVGIIGLIDVIISIGFIYFLNKLKLKND